MNKSKLRKKISPKQKLKNDLSAIHAKVQKLTKEEKMRFVDEQYKIQIGYKPPKLIIELSAEDWYKAYCKTKENEI